MLTCATKLNYPVAILILVLWGLGSAVLYRLGPEWWRRWGYSRLAAIPALGVCLLLGLIAYTVQAFAGPAWLAFLLVVAGVAVLFSTAFVGRPRFLIPPGYLEDARRRDPPKKGMRR